MQGNEELKKRQILSAQIDLSKFNKGDFIKATEEEKKQQMTGAEMAYIRK